MTSLTRRAYAKINLTLDIGQRRPDGYHGIRSVMQTIALHDTLTVTQTPEQPGVRLEIIGEEAAGVPADESNLVHRAAVRLQKVAAARGTLPASQSGLHLQLHKRIPSQAGLGGGSSDAAAALLAVNDLFGLLLTSERLTEIGTALGADVPFFLSGGTALVEGLGERVTLLPPLPSRPLILVKPLAGVSTAAAYAALDAVPNRRIGLATAAWLEGDCRCSNDFEAVILPNYPEVAAAYHALSWTGETRECFRATLCGSGAAVFCIVPTASAASEMAARISTVKLGKVWLTETQGVNT